ncbi:5'-nucleotidase C-terminal domain-containing protein [Demequina sediminicola]|uniref:5'-nucleotidase C-terminal domain-containing protein n=1 Tax=Demequina sediminicola TaxID=1095026 RepID=UPI000A438F3A|nr:5'-nucleotidase C-terminal domain-containing protein [Demequina sediminicola]
MTKSPRMGWRSASTLSAVAASTLAVAAIAVPASAADAETAVVTPPEGGTVVQILGTNDFHGRILPDAFGGSAGAASLAGAVDALEADYPNSVFAAAGDLVGASTFESFIADDEPTIEALSLAGLDVSAVGNHEFDTGFEDLRDRIMPSATWEYLGANVRYLNGDPALPETWVQTFGDGDDAVDVGFIGAVTDETPSLVAPSGIADLHFENEAVAANRSADALTEAGAELIVLLVHEGAPTQAYDDAVDTSNDFGAMLADLDPAIDAVISGHTHLEYDHRVPVDEWVQEGRAVMERPVVSSGQYGMNLNRLIFSFDAAGDVVGLDTSVVDLFESGADAPVYAEDPDVAAVVAEAVANADKLGAVELGILDDPLYRARLADGAPGSSRGAESTLGNAVADVQLWATSELDTQIAFMNPGGLRADLLGLGAGESASYPSAVTYKQAAEVQPFANTLVTMTLTGDQIAQVLEEQWQPEGSSRPFLRLGTSEGFEYTYDPEAPAGERILSMWLNGEQMTADGEYRVVANSFLASGGDNFSTLTEGSNVADSGRVDLQAMVDYLDQVGSLSADYRQHAVSVTGLPETIAVGDEVTFQVGSLLMTDPDGVTDKKVAVEIAGKSRGADAVVNEISAEPFDEHGTAEISFKVPSAAKGESVITLTGKQTGTTVRIPVTVGAKVTPVCSIDYEVHGEWPGGFIAQVTVTNTSKQDVDGWNVGWNFTGDESVRQLWNGTVSEDGSAVTVANPHWDTVLEAGSSATFGFLGTTTDGAQTPADLTLNGAACQG